MSSPTEIRCLHICMRRAQLIVTYENSRETALCLDHYYTVLRYEDEPILAVRGTCPPPDDGQ